MLLGVKIVVASGSWWDLQQSKCQLCQFLWGKCSILCCFALTPHFSWIQSQH